MRWEKVTLVGVGLLGGSLGLALKRRGMAESIAGFVRRQASIAECEKAGCVDFATRDLAKAVQNAGLVVFCTPLAQMLPIAKEMLPSLRAGAIVTDVGSVKAGMVRDMDKLFARTRVNFVGSHPMAGGEKMGVAAARADLFVNAACIVTPSSRTKPKALRAVRGLWRGVGGRVLQLSPGDHDSLVSRSSHLPHFVAAAVVRTVLTQGKPREQGEVCANGFRDVTRVASGSPEMWRDIGIANSARIGKALAAFIRDLRRLQRVIRAGDAPRLQKYLAEAKFLRDQWQSSLISTTME
ncbi:MAG TPA: prephenate dehydrogenase/arogenate dehydrogenase family protein [Verrucomicrobiae bacterium]|nr:prephenate dehydrogenase/arogenate dehydrogenase family protein [Verrucomicrobiae bacterium]